VLVIEKIISEVTALGNTHAASGRASAVLLFC